MSFDGLASNSGPEGLTVAEPPSRQPVRTEAPSIMRSGAVPSQLAATLGRLYREIFGRGPVKTTTHTFDAGYVTFLSGVLAPYERVLVRSGRASLVRDTRITIREAERERLVAEVQRLTGQPVLHDSFQFQPEQNLAIELVWIPSGSEHADGDR
jgi:uncharacterized protein YbcI